MTPLVHTREVVRRCRRALLGSLLSIVLASSAQALIISEVLFNPPGPDAGQEYIELYNDSGTIIDLSQWSLGWGVDDYTLGTLDLTGSFLPGRYLVIGGPTSSFVLPSELPNGFFNAAGVGLFNMDASLIVAASVPVDAVIYTQFFGFNTDLLDPTGSVGAINGNTTGAGQTVARDAFGVWGTQPASSPGVGPMVPEPSTALLLGLGLAFVGARHHRRL